MKSSLNYIIFETTGQCNLKCKYCYNYWHLMNPPQESDSNYSQAIKTLKRLFTVAEVNHVTFSGGEPFLADRFMELVLFCRMKKTTVSVISNGNTGTPDDYGCLIDLGVGLFQFPFHSFQPEKHDYLTGVNGSWEKSVRSIKEVLKKSGRVVAVIVLTKENCCEISSTLGSLQSLGVKDVMLARFNLGGRGVLNKEMLIPSKKELATAFFYANEYALKNKINITSNVCVPFCIIKPEDYPLIRILSCSLDLANRPFTLDASGNLRICNHSPVIMGNIFDQKLEDILNSDYMSQWQQLKPEFCDGCELWSKCLGGCRAASEQMGLTLADADPILQYMH